MTAKKTARPRTAAAVAKLMAAGAADGWTATVSAKPFDCYGDAYDRYKGEPVAAGVRFERTEPDVACVVVLNVSRPRERWDREGAWQGWTVEGHTILNGGSFTRVGIDCSSCKLVDREDRRYDHGYGAVADLLAGEWQRCVDVVARRKTMVAVPGLPGGWSVTPDGKARIAAELKAGKSHTFAPHGMGVAYRVVAGAPRERFRWTPLSAAFCAFFGVDRASYETLDWD